MVIIFLMAFVSVPSDSFSLVGACKLGVIDSSDCYLFKVRVVLCSVFWGNFWVTFLIIIPGSCKSWAPNNVVISSGCDEVRVVVRL